MKRKIYITSDISDENYAKFTEQLTELEGKSHTLPIELELCSYGGSAYSALAYAGRIKHSPCDVKITAYGLVASAAVLILAAGDHRTMSSEAWLMVHEDSGKLRGDVVDLEKASAHMRRLENQWAELLAEYTTTCKATWTKLHKETTYLTAKECLLYGIIDKVLK